MTTIQEKELEILKEVIKVIEANGLHYCAVGGTCLGAVRHKGFIPWDDDIDIALPRKDYERFRTELYKQLPPHLQKLDCDCEKSPSCDNLYLKIHDVTTTFLERKFLDLPDIITGVFVDIFPLDGRPDHPLRRKLWYFKYIVLMATNTRRRYPVQKIRDIRGLVKEVYGGLLKRLFRFNFFSDVLRRFLSKWDVYQTKTAIWNGAGRHEARKFDYKLSFDSDFFTDTISVPFEDTTIRVPRRYHDYLSTHFGDYMKLPPENERGNWHHVVLSDMDKPCAYYAQLILDGKIDLS